MSKMIFVHIGFNVCHSSSCQCFFTIITISNFCSHWLQCLSSSSFKYFTILIKCFFSHNNSKCFSILNLFRILELQFSTNDFGPLNNKCKLFCLFLLTTSIFSLISWSFPFSGSRGLQLAWLGLGSWRWTCSAPPPPPPRPRRWCGAWRRGSSATGSTPSCPDSPWPRSTPANSS